MLWRLAADVVVLMHVAFVAFVVLGGFAVILRPRLAWLHAPAALWGALVEAAGWICPLTPLENHLRRHAGGTGYDTGFIEQYLLPLLYPDRLTREIQWLLALTVLAVNAVAYALAWRRCRAARREERDSTPDTAA